MSEISDLDAYRRIAAVAEELEALSRQGCGAVAGIALDTAATTLKGIAQALYEHAIETSDGRLDS